MSHGNPNNQLPPVKEGKKKPKVVALPAGANPVESRTYQVPDVVTGNKGVDSSLKNLATRLNYIAENRVKILLELSGEGQSTGRGAAGKNRKCQLDDNIREVVNMGKGAEVTFHHIEEQLTDLGHHMPLAFPFHMLTEPKLSPNPTKAKK